MAQIGSVWKNTSWAVPAWAANTWADAVAHVFNFYLARHHRRAGAIVRRFASHG